MASQDDQYINLALGLALKGMEGAHPNPMVGCVIVRSGKVVGKGYHSHFGGPHAEINALRNANEKTKGATLYVTLEPCSHVGKTPPCLDAILKSGLSRVVIADKDPNPKVSGRSIRALKKSGIKVTVGPGEKAARQINRPFFKLHETGKPFITYKTAMTLDGKIASENGSSRWITGSPARRLVHQIRSEVDAVLVGTSTALRDNPRLTSHGKGRNPVRIVIDRNLKLPLRSRVFDGKAPAVLITSRKPAPEKKKLFEKKNIICLTLPAEKGRFSSAKMLRAFGKMGIAHLLIEGGGETIWPFVKGNLVDEYLFFIAPKILGGRKAKTPVDGEGFKNPDLGSQLEVVSASRIGKDFLIKARPKG